jgi:hypothetical protein
VAVAAVWAQVLVLDAVQEVALAAWGSEEGLVVVVSERG